MHVRPQRPGRLPGDQRQADERARPAGRRCDPVPHRGEDLLLAGGPCPVVLVRGASVLADAREAKRLASGEVVVARPERDALATEAVGADAVLQGDVDPAERVDQLREVREAHQDHVVDPQSVAEEALHRPDRQRGATKGVSGVDLLRAVARDGRGRVAQDGQLPDRPEPDPKEQDAVRARRTR